jgi:hypothetical protein
MLTIFFQTFQQVHFTQFNPMLLLNALKMDIFYAFKSKHSWALQQNVSLYAK